MDISSIGSTGFSGFGSFQATSRLRTLSNNAALLPAPPRPSSGLGLGQGIYDAVAKQAQGLVAGGRTAINAANAVLGIDTSKTGLQPPAAKETETESPARNITDELLKESGYVKPADDPYVVRTDFFA